MNQLLQELGRKRRKLTDLCLKKAKAIAKKEYWSSETNQAANELAHDYWRIFNMYGERDCTESAFYEGFHQGVIFALWFWEKEKQEPST